MRHDEIHDIKMFLNNIFCVISNVIKFPWVRLILIVSLNTCYLHKGCFCITKLHWIYLHYSGGNGSFYVTADHIQAVKRAKLKSGKHSHAGRGKNKTSKKKRSAPKGPFSPAIVKFKIDRQELYQEFKCKRFKTGQYADWANFIQLSRNCQNYHDYDIVEGPFDSTAGKGSLRKPKGHQLGIFSQAAKEYFDDHCISIPHQLPAETVNSLPISMQSITIS